MRLAFNHISLKNAVVGGIHFDGTIYGRLYCLFHKRYSHQVVMFDVLLQLVKRRKDSEETLLQIDLVKGSKGTASLNI